MSRDQRILPGWLWQGTCHGFRARQHAVARANNLPANSKQVVDLECSLFPRKYLSFFLFFLQWRQNDAFLLDVALSSQALAFAMPTLPFSP